MKPKEFANLVGVSVRTLQRWDVTGKLPAKRTLSNHRYYTYDDLRIAQGLKPVEKDRKTIIYCRVSVLAQKPELLNQVSAMEAFTTNQGLIIDQVISEVGGGLKERTYCCDSCGFKLDRDLNAAINLPNYQQQ